MVERDLERLSIDTIRGLAMDMVERAGAGHPGTAMALAPLGYAIFRRLRANPQDPQWPGRGRFVLSSGHACVLQYALLHQPAHRGEHRQRKEPERELRELAGLDSGVVRRDQEAQESVWLVGHAHLDEPP